MSRQWLGYPEPDEELVKAIPRITPDHLAQRMVNESEKAEIALIDVRRADLTVSYSCYASRMLRYFLTV